jgi:predicted RNA-binding protein with PIN domain
MQKLITMQKLMPQTTTKLRLTFNMSYIDELFPAFQAGDFAVLYGSQNVTFLAAQLCVRAHLPAEQGGLESKVLFVDAANSSSLSSILQVAEQHQMEPRKMQEQIQTLRAYTAYRLHSLIVEKLEQAIKTSGAKLVVISDVMRPFLTENIDDQEARTAYNQIMNYLSNFAKKQGIIIIATNPAQENNARSRMLQEITAAKAGVILRYTKTQYTSDIELEKHPSYMLGIMDFKPETKTLTDY